MTVRYTASKSIELLKAQGVFDPPAGSGSSSSRPGNPAQNQLLVKQATQTDSTLNNDYLRQRSGSARTAPAANTGVSLEFFQRRLMLSVTDLSASVEDNPISVIWFLIQATVFRRRTIMKTLDKQGIAVGNFRTAEESSSFLMMLSELHSNQPRKKLLSIGIREFAIQLAHPFAYNEKQSVERMVKQIDDQSKQSAEPSTSIPNFFQQLRNERLKSAKDNPPGGKPHQGFGPELKHKEAEELAEAFMTEVHKPLLVSEVKSATKSYSGMSFQVYIYGLETSIRAIPAKPIKLKFLSFEGKYIQANLKDSLRETELGKVMGSKITFFDANLYVDELRTSVGINLQDHYKTILSYIRKVTKMTSSSIRSTYMENFVDKTSPPDPKASPTAANPQANKGLKWWDKNRLIIYGNAQIKLKKLAMDVLTSTSSKMEECLRLSMDTLYLKYNEKLEVYIADILVSRLVDSTNQKNSGEAVEIKEGQTSILKIPLVEATFKYNWVTVSGATETSKTANENLFMLLLQKKTINENDLAATKLKVQLSVNIPSKSGYHEHPLVIQNENLQKTIELSPVPVFHYQSELFSSLIELPQLSNEYLRSKGIRIMNLDAFSNQPKEKPQAPSQPTPKSDKPTPEAPGTPIITLQREESKRPGDVSPRGKPRTPRLKEQVTDEGTLKNLLESVKIGPEFASYINLISVTLDEQLNMATQKNLLSILDDVEFRINTSHLRMLMTNLEKTQHLKVKTHKDDPNLYSLRGIQAVMRSLNFTTVLFKSQTNIRKEVFRRLFHSEGEKLLQWAAKNGRGRIQTMYASFFDSTHLLSLLPKNLEKIRRDRFEESLESPEAFRKFFGLDFVPIKAFQHGATHSSPKQATSPDLSHINHLFNIKTAQEFFPFFMKKSFELRQQREEEKKKNRDSSNSKLGFDRPLALLPTLSGNSEAASENLDSRELPSQSLFAGLLKKTGTRDSNRTKASPGKDSPASNTTANFEFSPVGGFFKAYDLRYDQNFRPDQEIATIDSQDNYRYVANTFNHFINVSSCKLLVGENLSKIGSLLILEPLGALQKKIKGGGSKQTTTRTRTLGAFVAPKYSASGTLNEDTKKEFVPSADQTKPPVTAVYSFGVKIQTPQINFFREDQGSQIIFTSNTGMLFFNMQHFLPYDFNQSDPKQLFYLNCHQMGIHSAPPSIDFHQKIFWIEDNEYSSYHVQPSANVYQSVRSPDPRRNGNLHSVSEPNLTHDSSFSKPNQWFVHSQPIKVNREGEWKTGVLNKLVTAEKMTVFELIKYKNPKANYDYSKKQAPVLSEPTTYWNGDPRYLSIRFIFDSFQSKLNGQDFDLLLELPKMFVNMVAKQDVKPDPNLYSKSANFPGKDKRDNRGAGGDAPTSVPTQEAEPAPKAQDKDISPEMRQLRQYGQAAIADHLKKHLTHRSQLSKDAYTSQSHIQFIFKDIMLTMTSLDSVPHLKMELKYLTFKARIVGTAYNSYQVGIQNIQISPCPEMRQRDQAMMPPDEQLKPDEMILKPIHKPSDKFLGSAGCNQVFYLEQNIYNIEGFKPDSESDTPSKAVWKAVNNLEIRADPFVINLNHEIIKFLQEYMFIRELNKIYKHLEKKENIEPRLYLERNDEYFRKKEQAIRIAKAEIKAEQDREKVKIADEEANILPTYYNLVKFNQMKLVITNKTTNILQQLEKMRLTVDTFEIREQFLTRRALLDRMLKYMLSAAFTRVLKYKVSCFSGGQSDEDEQGAAEKEEDRKLQILMG